MEYADFVRLEAYLKRIAIALEKIAGSAEKSFGVLDTVKDSICGDK